MNSSFIHQPKSKKPLNPSFSIPWISGDSPWDFPTRFSDLPMAGDDASPQPGECDHPPWRLASGLSSAALEHHSQQQAPERGPVAFSETMVFHGYHLVMTNITMENHRF